MKVFDEVIANPGRVALDFKAKGGKVIGTRCLYVPEEIIWAAGMLPYPVYGTPEPVRLSDAYFQSCSCEFVRNVFDRALEGNLKFLDGLAFSNTCDSLRKLYDMWKIYQPGGQATPLYIVNNPQKLGESGNHDYFVEELRHFQGWVEERAGRKVTPDALRQAITLYDETRKLLRELYGMRQEEPSRVSGEEAFKAAVACSILPRDQANPLLKELLADMKARPASKKTGPRIMVTGSILDHPALIKMIEDEGGQVVADDLCPTSRLFWHQVGSEGDPIEALYKFHNRRPLCACMHPLEARLDYLTAMAKEFKAMGVIHFNLKYCHPFLYDTPLVQKQLEANGLQVHVLEVGHDLSGHGQLRTRIQAFIEMLDL
jgi:benzoyl-CoA reductase subunit C